MKFSVSDFYFFNSLNIKTLYVAVIVLQYYIKTT